MNLLRRWKPTKRSLKRKSAKGGQWRLEPTPLRMKRVGPGLVEHFVRHAHATFLDTTRNTGNRGDTRSNSSSGASLSIGRCALAADARFK